MIVISYVLTLLKVEDYTRWRSAFDDAGDIRKAGGMVSSQIFHIAEDPNNLVILFEWDTLENARRFMESGELKERMQKSGVTGKPDTLFIEKIE